MANLQDARMANRLRLAYLKAGGDVENRLAAVSSCIDEIRSEEGGTSRKSRRGRDRRERSGTDRAEPEASDE